MYLKFFQLNTKPFQITADPKFLWMGEKHKEALATLRYGILDNRGFLLLTGEVGTGKTILINRLTTMLETDTVVASMPDPDLVSMDFYNLLADGLKMNRTFDSKGAFLIHLRDFLHKCYADRKQVLLIIDESQRLSHRLLEDIRVLSNIELHDRKLINIFFVGQQEFNSTLSTPENRALAQRITVRYHISPLEQNEVGEYIRHRLKVAGTTQKLFTTPAIREVYGFSGGIPRLINIICDHALLTAYARGAKVVDEHIIKECAEELRIPFNTIEPEDDDFRERAPDTRAITNAVAKSTGRPVFRATGGKAAGAGGRRNEKADSGSQQWSPVWRFFYAGIAILFVAIAAHLALHFTSADRSMQQGTDKQLSSDQFTTSPEQAQATGAPRQGMANGTAASPDTLAEERIPSPNPVASAADDRREPPPVPARASIPERAMGEVVPLPLLKEKFTVYFKLNSNEIEDRSYGTLDRIATFLEKYPNQTVHVSGFTDSSGTPGYNEHVSRFRAGTVKSYLVGKGAQPDRIQVFAMGQENPIASNETAEGRELNRRVEIEFPQAQGRGQ